jgi:hypothetical protein
MLQQHCFMDVLPQLYEQSYKRAIQDLMIEQTGRHRRDEYLHGELKLPMQSTKTKTIGE